VRHVATFCRLFAVCGNLNENQQYQLLRLVNKLPGICYLTALTAHAFNERPIILASNDINIRMTAAAYVWWQPSHLPVFSK